MFDTVIIEQVLQGWLLGPCSTKQLKGRNTERGIPGGQMNNVWHWNHPAMRILVAQTFGWKMFEPLENLGVEHLFGQVERIEDLGATTKDCHRWWGILAKPWWSHRVQPLSIELAKRSWIVEGFLLCCLWWCFRDRDLLVVSGGDSAVEEASFDSVCKTRLLNRRDQLAPKSS